MTTDRPAHGANALAHTLKYGADDSLRPLLFLDLDDVLCINKPYGGYDVFQPAAERPADLWERLWSPTAVGVLKEVLAKYDPRVVLTTSWLRLLNKDGFVAVFRHTGLGEVSDALHPSCEAPQDDGKTRHDAIMRWLNAHYQGERFVVLDDDSSGTGLRGSKLNKSGHVVLCKTGVGLTQSHVPDIKRALRAKRPAADQASSRFQEVKCGVCGWVHIALPRPVAEASVAEALAYAKSKGEPATESVSSYRKCFRCGQSTSQFVPALESDAPAGSTLQACVMP